MRSVDLNQTITPERAAKAGLTTYANEGGGRLHKISGQPLDTPLLVATATMKTAPSILEQLIVPMMVLMLTVPVTVTTMQMVMVMTAMSTGVMTETTTIRARTRVRLRDCGIRVSTTTAMANSTIRFSSTSEVLRFRLMVSLAKINLATDC